LSPASSGLVFLFLVFSRKGPVATISSERGLWRLPFLGPDELCVLDLGMLKQV